MPLHSTKYSIARDQERPEAGRPDSRAYTADGVPRLDLSRETRKRLVEALPEVVMRSPKTERNEGTPRRYKRTSERRLSQHDACDFVQAARFVVLDSALSSLAIRVYLVLAAHATQTTVERCGHTWVGQNKIAAYVGRSARSGTISKAIRELQEAGYIKTKRRFSGSNGYLMLAESNRVGFRMERVHLLNDAIRNRRPPGRLRALPESQI